MGFAMGRFSKTIVVEQNHGLRKPFIVQMQDGRVAVESDVSHYKSIPGLKIQNWAKKNS